MPTRLTTGYARVTIVARQRQIDISLPEDVALVELLPELIRAAGIADGESAHRGHVLTRLGGDVLDPLRPLSGQHVLDGEVLYLSPVDDAALGVVYDDVVETVAEVVAERWAGWSARGARLYASWCALALLLAAAALTGLRLRSDHPVALAGSVAGAAVLLSAAALISRLAGEATIGNAVAAAGVGWAIVAGLGAVPVAAHGGYGDLQVLGACAALLVASAAATLAVGGANSPIFYGPATAGLLATLAVFGLVLADTSAVRVAAGTAAVIVLAFGFLPGLAVRMVRLSPAGFSAVTDERKIRPVARDLVAEQTRRAHTVLTAVSGGAGAVVATSCGVLAFAGGDFAPALAGLAGAALLLRARSFGVRAEVLAVLCGGVVALGLTFAGLVTDAGPAAAYGWPVAATAGLGVILLLVSLSGARTERALYLGRFFDIAEMFLLIAVLPVAFGVLDLYGQVRQLTS